jgi:hypothetical protein
LTLFELLLVCSLVVGPGALATADEGVLEGVEARRIRNGWGLSEETLPGVVLIAIDDCEYLGNYAWMFVDSEPLLARVVDCTNGNHTKLADHGILADVNDTSLNHKEALLVLWR